LRKKRHPASETRAESETLCREGMRGLAEMKKRHSRGLVLGLLAVCVLLTAGLWGCAARKNEEAGSALQPIVVGCDDYEPYTYIEASGEYSGIDVELAREAFHRIGYEPTFQMIQWEDKDELLNSGAIDCLWSCFTMTGREELYEWAGPYLYSRHVVVVRADSDIWTLADLKGRRVGVQATTKPETIFLERTDPSIPQIGRLYCCSSMADLHALLRKGYVDAIASHEDTLKMMVEDSGGAYRMLDESLYISELGVAFEKGSHKELAKQLYAALQEMKQDGTMDSIVSRYGLDPQEAVWGGDAS